MLFITKKGLYENSLLRQNSNKILNFRRMKMILNLLKMYLISLKYYTDEKHILFVN